LNNPKFNQPFGEVETSELIEADFKGLEDIELLELLFGLFMIREHSQGLSRICQRHFGSLSSLIGASDQALRQAGLPDEIIVPIKLIRTISGRVVNQTVEKLVIDVDQVGQSKN